VRGYVKLPEGWKRVSADGPGPFVTREVFRGPDGAELQWSSRPHRKRVPARSRQTQEPVWWRPRTRGWWIAVLFSVGSLCFVVGAVASQSEGSSPTAIGVTFFVGSLFFTAAAYLQYAEAANVQREADPRRRRKRWRPASWEPNRIDWLAALVQLVGTVLFNISTFTALNHNLTTHQVNHRVWAPDAFGSVAFLIASELAFAEVCHRWFCLRCRSLEWWIVAINLLGSVAFGIAAVASLAEPSTGFQVSARIANAGTAAGGVCFLVGAVMLIPEAAGSAQPLPEAVDALAHQRRVGGRDAGCEL
jgi:YrhK-like protein